MRIISGTHKGKRIQAPKKLPVRPTTDMAKEALFNILNNHFYFEDLSVLDLFAGTGNISYEFASRGASPITAVDAHRDCVQFIRTTAEAMEFPISTTRSDVIKFLERTIIRADVIFADPPYDMALEEFQKIRDLVFERQLLNQGGMLIIEHGKHTDLDDLGDFMERRKYGSSVFSLFRAE